MAKKIKPNKEVAFNPIEGKFDLVSGNNFSYTSVPESKRLKIRENDQMIIHEEFELDGELDIEGSFMVED